MYVCVLFNAVGRSTWEGAGVAYHKVFNVLASQPPGLTNDRFEAFLPRKCQNTVAPESADLGKLDSVEQVLCYPVARTTFVAI